MALTEYMLLPGDDNSRAGSTTTKSAATYEDAPSALPGDPEFDALMAQVEKMAAMILRSYSPLTRTPALQNWALEQAWNMMNKKPTRVQAYAPAEQITPIKGKDEE